VNQVSENPNSDERDRECLNYGLEISNFMMTDYVKQIIQRHTRIIGDKGFWVTTPMVFNTNGTSIHTYTKTITKQWEALKGKNESQGIKYLLVPCLINRHWILIKVSI
jgi:hypothetical protein